MSIPAITTPSTASQTRINNFLRELVTREASATTPSTASQTRINNILIELVTRKASAPPSTSSPRNLEPSPSKDSKSAIQRFQQTEIIPSFTSGDVKTNNLGELALSMKGKSTAAGPGGGNLACAWIVSRVLSKKGIEVPNEFRNSVPRLVAYLKENQGATFVPASEARPGDIAIAFGEAHMGIVTKGEGTNAKVLSNSSSRRRLVWTSDTSFGGYYGGDPKILRLPY